MMGKSVAYVGVAAAIGGAVTFTALRFRHPEFTETQLFLAYWPLELLICVGAALYVLGMRLKP